jgi:hypothetical protein
VQRGEKCAKLAGNGTAFLFGEGMRKIRFERDARKVGRLTATRIETSSPIAAHAVA